MTAHVLPAAAIAVILTALPQQPPRVNERVDVARILVDARVVDGLGGAVLGLGAGDFAVRVDGKPARVESALWVGGAEPQDPHAPLESASITGAIGAAPLGRSVVLLFQKDLIRSRIIGLMRMLIETRGFLDTLAPNDRVAILSFDSHLKIWTDFTGDRERLRRILEHGVLFENPPALEPPSSSSSSSILDTLSAAEAHRTYTIEKGLELIANALEPLPGAKSVVLVGYGFGRLSSMGVRMEHDYEPARRALLAARASVFSLDVTDADYHSLEAGLQLISEETGGFFVRTHIFPAQAMRRLAGALAGYYVLFVEKPEGARRRHVIDVQLVRRKGTVLARTGYEG